METIIFAPATFNLAETTRMIEVANYLKDEAHCVFFGFSKTYKHLIEDAGFTFYLLNPIFTLKQEKQLIKVDQMKSIRHPFTFKIVEERVKNELAFYQKKQPKAIITGTNITAFLSARIYKVPLIYIKPFALTREQLSLHDAPAPKQLTQKIIPTNFIWSICKKIILHTRWKPYALKRVAENFGLTLPKYTIDLLSGELDLLTTHPMFISEVPLPRNMRIVGPIYARLDLELPRPIKKVIQVAKANKVKLIYLSMGSSGNKKMILKLLNILTKLDCVVIAPVKHFITGDSSGNNFGENIYLTELLPAHLISKEVDLSIIHGGEGTVQTACLSGKPFIGIGLQYEQELNIWYCEQFGNALTVRPNEIKDHKIINTLHKIFSRKYSQKAIEMKQLMDIVGAKNAAEIIKTEYL
ncbi:UDP-glucuronosyltransferase-related glycosyl transferase [Enterococcus mundtii 3F]|uniref:glycosyltransferase n=1 Tax=Enterococcus mundtii TaxID=53346 RepID=UPI002302513F|nr:glycosyltransferase [Enterococcus mundtii]MDA9460450.1 UDP-glucuronosyltransferase-related glycosyl transferase [Enterococcus mundtii 3F]